MYKYYLIINNNDKKNTDYNLELSYNAFDSIDAKEIAEYLTKNLTDINHYTILRKDYKLIEHKKFNKKQ